MTTVASSLATTDATPSQYVTVDAAVAGSHWYLNVNATSLALNGVPSDHVTPVRSFQVTVLKSAVTPPLDGVGISAANPFGTGRPSLPNDASGSRTRRLASASFVPVAWCAFRIVGACQ